jgi:RNA polymerase sigma-70 factor (ECF subfamily)
LVTTLEQVFRAEWGRILATLIGFLGDFDLAEEAAQEAFTIAADRWPRDGVPRNPRAWLMTAARNHATDRIRRERTLVAKFGLLVAGDRAEAPMSTTTPFPDERLELIFTCCHPALAIEAQVALTLRTLGGLTTDEIARAFLVPERTMAQRLVRAKRKIKAAAIPLRLGADRGAVRPARPPDRLAGRGAQPRHRHRRDRRPRGRPAYRRPTRSGRLPLPALDQGRTLATPRADP